MWQVTRDTGHMQADKLGKGNLFSKFQLSSSCGFQVNGFWPRMTNFNELISDKGVRM